MPSPLPAAPAADSLPPLPPPDRSRWLRDLLAFWGVLAVFGIFYLGWGLTALGIWAVLPAGKGSAFGRRAIARGFRILLRLTERAGLVHLDLAALDSLRGARGLVLVPNHLSMIDVMLVVSRVPDTVCIMKAGLERNPMLGGGRLGGYIPNSGGLSVIRRATEALRGGANLLVFPEGTRSRDGRLGPFHPGFALIARRAGAAVQPVLIESNTRYLGKGWPFWRRPSFPLRYRVRLGERVAAAGGSEAFAEGLRRQMAARLGTALR
ncbi:lysophospholipid acyltransferase family protein [Pararoseomonas indoligenes]|uniref:1-acyl-sn-glycerol-3-phosphate acyltransferase n=1 Tax=Roseomonas indoligenes TaxID=2820811 RepID=A0A940N440_9PROT|nr:lysophospholipid acyltransferase family protein [Pararoseomonas indoligenes]MBP0495631.1 1-acyl-sn-glycerol-3-phosphate acyltransferase [Pararoseomonas indoligenes]